MSSAVLTQDKNPELMTVFFMSVIRLQVLGTNGKFYPNNIHELIIKPVIDTL